MTESDPKQQTEFERAAQEGSPGLLVELWQFVRENKKWWLIPILLGLGFIALLAALSSSGAAPFIYTLF